MSFTEFINTSSARRSLQSAPPSTGLQLSANSVRYTFDTFIAPVIIDSLKNQKVIDPKSFLNGLTSPVSFVPDGKVSPYDKLNGASTVGAWLREINGNNIASNLEMIQKWKGINPIMAHHLAQGISAARRFESNYSLAHRQAEVNGSRGVYAKTKTDSAIVGFAQTLFDALRLLQDQFLNQDSSVHAQAYVLATALSATPFVLSFQGKLVYVSCSHISYTLLDYFRSDPERTTHSLIPQLELYQQSDARLNPLITSMIKGGLIGGSSSLRAVVSSRLKVDGMVLRAGEQVPFVTIQPVSVNPAAGSLLPNQGVLPSSPGGQSSAPKYGPGNVPSMQEFCLPFVSKLFVGPSTSAEKIAYWNQTFPNAPYPTQRATVDPILAVNAFDAHNAWDLAVTMMNESSGNLVAIGDVTESGKRAIGLLQSLSDVHGDRSTIAELSIKGQGGLSVLIGIYIEAQRNASPVDDWLGFWFTNFLTGHVSKGFYTEKKTGQVTILNPASVWYSADRDLSVATPLIQAVRFYRKHGFVFGSAYWVQIGLPALQALKLDYSQVFEYDRQTKKHDKLVSTDELKLVESMLADVRMFKQDPGTGSITIAPARDQYIFLDAPSNTGFPSYFNRENAPIDFSGAQTNLVPQPDSLPSSFRQSLRMGTSALSDYVTRASMFCSELEDGWAQPYPRPIESVEGSFIFYPGWVGPIIPAL